MELPLEMIVAEVEASSPRLALRLGLPRQEGVGAAAATLSGTAWLHGMSRLALVLVDLVGAAIVTAVFLWGAWMADYVLEGDGVLALTLLLLGALVCAGSYFRLVAHPALEMQRTARVVFVVFAGSAVGALSFGQNPEAALLVATYGGLGVILTPFLRLGARIALGRTGWWGAPVAVLASADAGEGVVDALRRWPEVGLRPVLLLEDRPAEVGWERGVWRDEVTRASSYAMRFGMKQAVVVMPDRSAHRRANDLRRFTRFFDRVFVVSGDPGFGTVCAAAVPASGLAGHVVRDAGRDRLYQAVKRGVDVAGALILLMLLSPLLAVIGLLIKLGSNGPVFYRQRRMGRGGVCYFVHKFRTMHVDAEARLEKILREDPDLHEQYRTFHKLTADPRVTRVGRFLRLLSLDELPQLWNVLFGEMSLVGPRAYIPREIVDMQGLERVVLQTRPGITGLWQVSGRNALSFEARVQLDVHYVHSSSGWLDLYILARTFPVVFRREGAS